MRRTQFGDWIIESTDDDLDTIEAFQEEDGDVYALIYKEGDTSGMFFFDVLRNDDGELVASSDSIFDSQDAAETYLKNWLTDIQPA